MGESWYMRTRSATLAGVIGRCPLPRETTYYAEILLRSGRWPPASLQNLCSSGFDSCRPRKVGRTVHRYLIEEREAVRLRTIV